VVDLGSILPSWKKDRLLGQIAAGGSVEVLTRDEHGVTVANIVNLYQADATNQELLHKASDLPDLPPDWRDTFSNVSGMRMVEFLWARSLVGRL
jgi:hypothetical protein